MDCHDPSIISCQCLGVPYTQCDPQRKGDDDGAEQECNIGRGGKEED